jgi:hypothetical protein
MPTEFARSLPMVRQLQPDLLLALSVVLAGMLASSEFEAASLCSIETAASALAFTDGQLPGGSSGTP